jgi:thymidylate kinase
MTRQQAPSVAIEGPCCAGKTTLSSGLIRRFTELRIAHVKCFADYVGGGRFLPRPVPESLSEDEGALHKLLAVEYDRQAEAREQQSDLMLMDRSVYTFLAHRYALEQVTGIGFFAPARRIVDESDLPTWPDLVLYLDVPDETIHARNHGKFPQGSIFIDRTFNAGVRSFYSSVADAVKSPIVRMDATLSPSTLQDLAASHIEAALT